MKVHNVRAGFATNSSSSHSIVMIPHGQRVFTKEYDRYSYGWEEFTLADPRSKSAYFVTQLWQALLSDNLSGHEAAHVIHSLLGETVDAEAMSDVGVDHQSLWYGLNETVKYHPQLVQDLFEFVQRPDVVILGGNDNSEGQSPPPDSFTDARTDIFGNLGHGTMRKDGQTWIMFNRGSGTKLRFSLDQDAEPYVKSSVPELVDLKVTDHCRYGCDFCYQGSLPTGVHAEWSHVKSIVEALGQLGVFEIAIGGGEPTHWPHLADLLALCAQHNIVPNFTTFGVDWLRNDQLVAAVKNHVGAIGVSVHDSRDLNKVQRIHEVINANQGRWDARRVNVTAQHVVGSVDISETAQVLERAWKDGWDLLLLGYKNVGFGTKVSQHDTAGLDTLLRLRQQSKPHYNTRVSMLGVDTAFVQQFAPILDELNISHVLRTNEEGKFSMYIDAVTLTQGPSSYMPDQMVPLDPKDVRDSIMHNYVNW